MTEVYQSITTENILHDTANILTEILWLNRNMSMASYPWKDDSKAWGKDVACIKKIIRDFEITPEQLAFFIYKCRPFRIDSYQFGTAIIKARQLLSEYNITDLVNVYRQEYKLINTIDGALKYKSQKSKDLFTFLRELEHE